MKLTFIPTIIAIGIAALIAYGFYSFHSSDNKILLSAGSFVLLALPLVLAIGANFTLPRTTANIRIVSGIFFIALFASNLTFSFCSFSTPLYIIINSILLMIFTLIIYSIIRVKL
jgi:hypothetical protein